MKEVIKKLIAEFWDKDIDYIPRKKITEELATAKSSIIITGPGRAGKSYTIYEIRDMIMKKGADIMKKQ
jgi:predicted AAA+ superfamily ATPase